MKNIELKNAIKDYKKSIKKSCCGSFADFINDSQIFGIICAVVQFVYSGFIIKPIKKELVVCTAALLGFYILYFIFFLIDLFKKGKLINFKRIIAILIGILSLLSIFIIESNLHVTIGLLLEFNHNSHKSLG